VQIPTKKSKEYLAKKQEAEEKGKNLMKNLFEPLIPVVAVNFIFQTVTSRSSTKDDPDRRTQVVFWQKILTDIKI
jgi:DNA polymerase-3 subunit alpha